MIMMQNVKDKQKKNPDQLSISLDNGKKESFADGENIGNVKKEVETGATRLKSDVELKNLQEKITEKEKKKIKSRIDKMGRAEFKEMIETPVEKLSEYEVKFAMLRRLNEMRAEWNKENAGGKARLKPLKYDKKLEKFAQDFVKEKSGTPVNRETEHYNLSGEPTPLRLKNAGLMEQINHHEENHPRIKGTIADWGYGENIVAERNGNLGAVSIEEMMQGFKDSTEHAVQLFNPYVNSIGIGYFGGSDRLVQVFADFK
ncbi:hypothetical protein AGMMS50249_4970 [candidate division SR1 bacterium]|nr:hypothetical protein AGMMS50249_4970 [candidate division SR1 bacterium]